MRIVGAPGLGYILRYVSHLALDEHFRSYMTHGAMMLKIDKADAPPPETPLVLRVEAPTGAVFNLNSLAGQYIGTRGLMCTFEEDHESRTALSSHLGSSEWSAAVRKEDPTTKLEPVIEPFDPNTVEPNADPGITDPQMLAAGLDLDPLPPVQPGQADVTVPNVLQSGTDDVTDPAGGEGDLPIHKPGPGEEYPIYVAKFNALADFVEKLKEFKPRARLFLPNADEDAQVGNVALLRVTLPGHNIFSMWSVVQKASAAGVEVRVDPNDEQYRKALVHPSSVSSKARLNRERPEDRKGMLLIKLKEKIPEEDEKKLPIRRRLARMGMDDKINMALSGDREERMALAMDSNRAIHHYLLKNAKITLDEIAFMARLPSLNPDVLDRIAENPSYTQNPSVTRALVYNPKTPVQTAIRLLDRLPRNEVQNLARRINLNRRLVMAAKKKLERRSF